MKSLKRKARLARSLSLSDWATLAEAWLRLFYFYVALFFLNYDRLKELPPPTTDNAQNASRPPTSARHIGRLTGYAARLHFIPATCLVKSLALQKMLSNRNIPAQIKIGARKIQNVLYAHAWVEVRGNPVGEVRNVAEKFQVLQSIAEIKKRQFI